MPKLNVKQKNWLFSGPVASGALWLGVALAMVLMAVIAEANPALYTVAVQY